MWGFCLSSFHVKSVAFSWFYMQKFPTFAHIHAIIQSVLGVTIDPIFIAFHFPIQNIIYVYAFPSDLSFHSIS